MLDKFFKIKIVYNSRNEIMNEKNNILLFIKIINVFEPILLLSYYLKLKEDYSIILLRNLE